MTAPRAASKKRGFFTLGTIRGTSIRLHLFAVVGLAALSAFSSRPFFGAALFLVIVVHELGHVVLVKRAHFTLVAIEIALLRGSCEYSGTVTPRAEAIIAWGGVLAQLVLAAVGVTLHFTLGAHKVASELATGWIFPNLLLAGLNLLPFGGLDGAKAWKVFRRVEVE